MPITPVDLREIEGQSSNIYEAIIVSAKKARLLNSLNKLEFNTRISAIVKDGLEDDLDEVENPDQLKVSLEFEKRDKSHLTAILDFLKNTSHYLFITTTPSCVTHIIHKPIIYFYTIFI